MENQVTIEKLVAEHHRAVYGYAYRLTGNQADAEDAVQQTFLTAHQCLHQLREPDRPLPWLFSIARSAWLKSRRRQRPTAAGALELNVDEIPGEAPQGEDIDREELQLALDQLSDEFRLVLVMFYFDELSYKEIAEELEIPPGTVMSRLSRAKAHLRKLLDDSNTHPQPKSNSSPTAKSPLTPTTPN